MNNIEKDLLSKLENLKKQKELYNKWLKLQEALLEASTYDIVKSMPIETINKKITELEIQLKHLDSILPLGWRKNL